jgi:hypothetical protein
MAVTGVTFSRGSIAAISARGATAIATKARPRRDHERLTRLRASRDRDEVLHFDSRWRASVAP